MWVNIMLCKPPPRSNPTAPPYPPQVLHPTIFRPSSSLKPITCFTPPCNHPPRIPMFHLAPLNNKPLSLNTRPLLNPLQHLFRILRTLHLPQKAEIPPHDHPTFIFRRIGKLVPPRVATLYHQEPQSRLSNRSSTGKWSR